jgi:hypothetical protein
LKQVLGAFEKASEGKKCSRALDWEPLVYQVVKVGDSKPTDSVETIFPAPKLQSLNKKK